jgi:hypothetical protein
MRAGIIEGETFPEPFFKFQVFESALIALRIGQGD